jgi:hypothetical protein
MRFELKARSCIPLSSLATERLEQAHGKAMKVASSARIPANKVKLRPFLRAQFRNAHALAGKSVRAYLSMVFHEIFTFARAFDESTTVCLT